MTRLDVDVGVYHGQKPRQFLKITAYRFFFFFFN